MQVSSLTRSRSSKRERLWLSERPRIEARRVSRSSELSPGCRGSPKSRHAAPATDRSRGISITACRTPAGAVPRRSLGGGKSMASRRRSGARPRSASSGWSASGGRECSDWRSDTPGAARSCHAETRLPSVARARSRRSCSSQAISTVRQEKKRRSSPASSQRVSMVMRPSPADANTRSNSCRKSRYDRADRVSTGPADVMSPLRRWAPWSPPPPAPPARGGELLDCGESRATQDHVLRRRFQENLPGR